MEEKLLKAKELKDLLLDLANNALYIRVVPCISYTMLIVAKENSNYWELLHSESFYSYENDPAACTLTLLRNFKAL